MHGAARYARRPEPEHAAVRLAAVKWTNRPGEEWLATPAAPRRPAPPHSAGTFSPKILPLRWSAVLSRQAQ